MNDEIRSGAVLEPIHPGKGRANQPCRVTGRIGSSNRYVIAHLDGTRSREVSLQTLLTRWKPANA